VFRRLFFIGLMVLALASCESAKERAQKHFEAAVELIKAGDFARGVVELRNVFKLDDTHREGRRLFADTLRSRGDLQGAYAQYLKLVEQYPDDVEGLTALAEIAFGSGNGTEARLRVDAALKAKPDDPSLLAMDAALDYAAAVKADDAAARDAAATTADALLAKDPALLPARQVLIARDVADGDLDGALALVDAGLKLDGRSQALLRQRLGLLDRLGDKAGIEAELKHMIELFPDDESIGATLVRWYVGEKRLDDAENWLKARIPAGGTDPEPRLRLVRFLSDLRGPQQALAELDRILALDPAPPDVAQNLPAFRSLHAGFLFTAGKHDEAVAEMERLLAGAQPSEQTNRLKVALAQMRAATGNQVGARALVEEVLTDDPDQVEAMKLKADWLIDDDKTDDAIVVLRAALGNAPQDAAIVTLLARAYERQGNRPLVGEMLSRAVALSNQAPAESMRYANYLLQNDEFRSAEDVLIDALRLDSSNAGLISLLAQTHIDMQDWPRAKRDIDSLRELGSDQALAAANELQARMLAGQNKSDELTAFLESLAASDPGGIGPEAAIIRAQVVAGNIDDALARARALAEAHGDDQGAQLILASVLARAGMNDEAERRLRAITAAAPTQERAWTMLYGLRLGRDDLDGAGAVLDAAEKALPDSRGLQWLRAGLLERQGDTEAAIRIYEAFYARDSDTPAIANNLASLLASTHDDAESLDRAWTVARRLKDTTVPAFADTYGWIAFRRDQADEALGYLELAARGLPQDPTVQYHLGKVYAALKRTDEARAQFEKARALLAQGVPGIPDLGRLIDSAMAGQ
jgi:tetratricopeptide (TPR) repeat protein